MNFANNQGLIIPKDGSFLFLRFLLVFPLCGCVCSVGYVYGCIDGCVGGCSGVILSSSSSSTVGFFLGASPSLASSPSSSSCGGCGIGYICGSYWCGCGCGYSN